MRSPKKRQYGSISTGTLRVEDLRDAFLSECDSLHLSRSERNAVRKIAARKTEEIEEEEIDQLEFDVDELTDILSNHAPAYMYFGSHPGDGADFGFWLSEDALTDFDGLKVSDLSEIPAGYTGEVLHVNDHGNSILYSVTRGRLHVVWAIV